MQNIGSKEYDIEKIKSKLGVHIEKFLQFHSKLYIAILGGEPLTGYNREITLKISKHLKVRYPESIIVMYSWRYEDNILDKYTKYIDYGVLGGYDGELYVENTLPASSNQYIYDFSKKEKLPQIRLKKGTA